MDDLKKILLVEDEAVAAINLKISLENAGFEIIEVVSTGAEAIVAMYKKPDLICLDISLIGEMNGITTAFKIREEHETPIIFMTGYNYEDTIEDLKKIKNIRFINKPFNINKLLKMIKSFNIK